ncbi:hypothetical protein IQ07DRAFT_606234 [Pyrenochaeta sp. DS3sAY3a]|nr:hypothetical protein IQ07DRAFT_606234 [Pyrenochaeta sp. DS3sAY3a]
MQMERPEPRAEAHEMAVPWGAPSTPKAQSDTTTRISQDIMEEDKLITILRDEQHLSWSEIAVRLNNHRSIINSPESFTGASVYSRYILNTPVVPPVPKSAARPRSTLLGSLKPVPKRPRVQLKADPNVRRHLEGGETADLQSAERTEMLIRAVNTVKEQFWTHVADEMERIGTKMYKAEDLEKRFHEVEREEGAEEEEEEE